MGAHIYALGHVIHLLTDMGQPEHVRNDVHLASLYEKQVEKLAEGTNYSFLPYFFDNNAIKYTVNRQNFKKARDYFHTTDNGTGIGLAEFTNRNFVSPTTNFDTQWYSLPTAMPEDTRNSLSVEQLYASIQEPLPSDMFGASLTGKVQFVASAIDDKQSPTFNTTNYRSASHSIFNSDVNMYHDECIDPMQFYDIMMSETEIATKVGTYPGCKKYTLNRWNYDSYRTYLAPRIVGYGAAFLKHLARGTMEIQLPNISALGNLVIENSTGGVVQLPLRLSNTTPNSPIEAIGEGKLVAVVTYADIQGEITNVYTSDEIAITSQQDPNYQAPSFQFVKKGSSGGTITDSKGVAIPRPFPLSMQNKTPYLQVIFRGKLGAEEDIIVVERRPLYDILKPIELHIAPPDSGVYALADHKANGFTGIKAKLSSDTPFDGKIIAAAMHHNNDCYSSDLKGEYNVGGQTRSCASSKYRSTLAFSKVSTATSASNISATPTEVGISFPDTAPIPFSATDLGLGILYYPTNETAPIGVSFKDISEPTYIAVINNTDYYSISGTYYPVAELPDEFVVDDHRSIEPTPFDMNISLNSIPAATISALPPGGYARFAVLTSPNQSTTAPFLLEMEGSSPNFRPRFSSGINAAVVQLNSSTNTISYSFLPTFRGVTAHYPIYFEQTRLGIVDGNPSTMPVIEAENQTATETVQP